jgi:hypothetical protein
MSISPILVLQARAEARALLFATCEYEDVEQALAPLLAYAIDAGVVDAIGAEASYDIIRKAFAGVAEP